MSHWLQVFIGALIALFPIVNPFGAIPLFLTVTGNLSEGQRRSQLLKACFYAFGILASFVIAGNLILAFFGISIAGIRIAGGFILGHIAWGMLHAHPKYEPSPEERSDAVRKGDVSFTPLAMPTLSGPGSIAVALGLTPTADAWYDYAALLLAIVVICLSSWLVLRASLPISKFLGVTGMNALTRMMGFILMCVGVQFIVNGMLSIIASQIIPLLPVPN